MVPLSYRGDRHSVLGEYGRDVLSENGKLLLDFAEDNKLALLNTLFCSPISGVSYTFQSANRNKGQARFDYILTKQANRRLIRCVNVRRPPLETPESDHNLVYAKVHIPRRSAPNRRKRYSTKKTPNTADLRRLMADSNFRCQVANAVLAALPSTPDNTCVRNIATEMADVMFSTAANWHRALSARAEHRAGAQGPVWRLRQTQHGNRDRRRGGTYAQNHTAETFAGPKRWLEKSSENSQGCRTELHLGFRPQTRGGDQTGFYKHLKTINLEGKRDRSSAYVKVENGKLLRDVELIYERWVRCFTLFSMASHRTRPEVRRRP